MDVRRVHGWVWCALSAGVIATVTVGWVGYRAHAQTAPTPTTGEPLEEQEEPLVPLPQRDHFAPYPADPGAWEYEDQSPEMRAMIDGAAEWAETQSGHDVHQAYRRASQWSAKHARKVRAERAAGLEGSQDLGVE